MIYEQNEDTNKEKESSKNNFQELTNIIEQRNSLEEFNSRLDQVKKKKSANLKTSQLKLLSQRSKKEKIKKSKERVRGLWGVTKESNVHMMESQKEKRENKGQRADLKKEQMKTS